jgi:hypothetical protein
MTLEVIASEPLLQQQAGYMNSSLLLYVPLVWFSRPDKSATTDINLLITLQTHCIKPEIVFLYKFYHTEKLFTTEQRAACDLSFMHREFASCTD